MQQQATDRAIDVQQDAAAQTRADFAPQREAGYRALTQLEAGINAPTDFNAVSQDPGFQFAQQQGEQGLQRRFAASGGRISGNALKAASRFNAGNAAQFGNAAYQRGQDRLNRLSALAGIGQAATGASAAAGMQAAGSASNLLSAQGNASAGARMAQANIWGNAINQAGAAFGRGGGGGMPMVNGGGFQNLPAYLLAPGP